MDKILFLLFIALLSSLIVTLCEYNRHHLHYKTTYHHKIKED